MNHPKEEISFRYEAVVAVDLPNAKFYRSGNINEARMDCPFCHAKGKLYWGKTNNLYYCQHCKSNGSVVRFHQNWKGFSTLQEAKQDLKQCLQDVDPQVFEKVIGASEENVMHSIVTTAAKIEVRDRVYRNMLNVLDLEDIDRQDLKKRGLRDAEIQALQIRTVPKDTPKLVKRMLKENYDFLCASYAKFGSNIPGLYPEDGSIHIVEMSPGILIPVVTRKGEISMFQVRRRPLREDASKEEKELYHKYTQFASSWKNGGCSTSGLERIHHVGFSQDDETAPETVCVTEGCLKADIASALEGGQAYIAVLGVNNLNQLEEEFDWLIRHGTKKIRIRFDMDFIDNPAVAKAIMKVNQILQHLGCISVLQITENATTALRECLDKFGEMENDHASNSEGISIFKIHKDADLKQVKDSNRVVVFNDLWDPNWKGIDDYLQHKKENRISKR